MLLNVFNISISTLKSSLIFNLPFYNFINTE